ENQGSFAHHPRTFSPSLVAHHGLGSTGEPYVRCCQHSRSKVYRRPENRSSRPWVCCRNAPLRPLSRVSTISSSCRVVFNASAVIAMLPYSLPAVQPRSSL